MTEQSYDTGEPMEPIEVGVLTDEELAIVAGTDGIAIFPVLADLSEADQAVAMRTAFRSLVARGLVEPGGPDEIARAMEAGRAQPDLAVELAVAVPDTLAGVVKIRREAHQTVAVSRTTSLGEEYCYAYLDDEVILLEVVSAGGAHHFLVRGAEDLLDVVMAWAINEEATDGHGEGIVIAPLEPGAEATPPAAVLEALGAAYLRADVIVLRAGDEHPPLVGIFSGPRGTWLSTARLASGEPVQLRPVAVDDARQVLAGVVTPG